jgi:hypothetical protein
MIDELKQLVSELIEDGIDRVALAKTLAIVDRFLLPPQPMMEQQLEAMLQKLEDYWYECSDLTNISNELQALRTMSPAELTALQWFDQCHDCGGRAWTQLREDYIVHDDIWHQACTAEPVMKDDCGLLCVGCIEQRLGRRLNSADFEAGVPLNVERGKSERLLDQSGPEKKRRRLRSQRAAGRGNAEACQESGAGSDRSATSSSC